MNKINLACNEFINVIPFLNKEFNLVKPQLFYKKNHVETNFDYFLKFDSKIYDLTDILEFYDVKTIGSYRFDKSKQYMLLDKLEINHPDFYKTFLDYNNDLRDDTYQYLIDEFNDDSPLLLKTENGARGIGQIKITRDSFYPLMNNIKTMSTSDAIKYLYDNYNIGATKNINNEEKEWIITAINNHEYFLNAFVNVEEEYRVLSFYGESPIIIKRKRLKGGWQANSSVSDYGELYNGSIEESLMIEITEMTNKLLDYLNTPWLSVDVYIDNQGRMGIFEFQMQFGYEKVPKGFLVEKINKSVLNLIKNDKNK